MSVTFRTRHCKGLSHAVPKLRRIILMYDGKQTTKKSSVRVTVYLPRGHNQEATLNNTSAPFSITKKHVAFSGMCKQEDV